MEGASMMYHGDYKKRCLLTILVSQILLLTQLISEIKKSTTAKGFFYNMVKNKRGSCTVYTRKLTYLKKVRLVRLHSNVISFGFNFYF